MIRKAKPTDIDAIFGLGMQALKEDAYETLIIDEDKVRRVATLCVSGAGNYAWVAEDGEGKVIAAVSVMVNDMLFYERKQASVVQFYSRGKNGEGVRLIKHMLEWARSRPIIKLVTFTLEPGADPRIGTMLEKLGLDNKLPLYTEVM